jgi:hypothetical protein
MTLEALPRWMAISMDWKGKDLEQLSPLMLRILFPRSSRTTACESNGPRVLALSQIVSLKIQMRLHKVFDHIM